jgi:hypothetical protein
MKLIKICKKKNTAEFICFLSDPFMHAQQHPSEMQSLRTQTRVIIQLTRTTVPGKDKLDRNRCDGNNTVSLKAPLSLLREGQW